MTRVVLTDAAKQDQLEIWLYIAADNPDAADRLLDDMDETLRLLSSAPGLGRDRDDIERPGLMFAGIGKVTFASRQDAKVPFRISATHTPSGERRRLSAVNPAPTRSLLVPYSPRGGIEP
jgi:toxin ParE1/3/4